MMMTMNVHGKHGITTDESFAVDGEGQIGAGIAIKIFQNNILHFH